MSELKQTADGYDMIGITETWANEQINDAEYHIPGFNMFRADRMETKGGGLILYVNDRLEASLSTVPRVNTFKESIWCNITLDSRKLLIGLIYRSPLSNTANDDLLLKTLEETIVQGDARHVLIIGDFNYPEIDYENEIVSAGERASSTRFFNKTQELCLIQHVTEPTRIRQGQQSSVLDYIFTDDENLVEQVNYKTPLGKSDHVVLDWNVTLMAKEMTSNQLKRNFWKGNYDEISSGIRIIDWKKLLEGKSVNDMWLTFREVLHDLIDLHVPLKEEVRKKKGKWLSRATIKKMKERNKAWKTYRQYPSGRNFEAYRSIRNVVNSLVRKDEDNHRKMMLQSFKGKPKCFYGYMRSLQTVKENVTALKKDNGELTSSDQETVEVLGQYFKDMFTTEDIKDIPVETESKSDWSDTNVDFSVDSIIKKLQKLPTDKSPGPDGIHNLLLHNCAAEVAEPLSLIFKASFESGILPQEWKSANVVPIFKKGARNDRANYRPISLTSVPCKVMESLIKEKLVEFLEKHNIISNSQHGFMSGKSCLTNLLESLECWTKALDDGYGLDIIYLDYRKAFDSVPHKRLIEKLKTYGITGCLRKWIESFLTSRKMIVGIRGTFSEEIEVISGVPQGSVLGPLLFLLFVNDLPRWIVNSMKMFADDTKLWCRIETESDSESLQKDLDSLANWSQKWMLEFNSSKCKVMHVGHKLNTKYFMNDKDGNTELSAVQEEKDLGVFFTSDLKASTQCTKSAAKARRIIGMVRRNFKRLDKNDFLVIYRTYIRPHLEYCIQAWSPHLMKDIQCLERVQKSATNLIPALKKYSYTDRLKKLGLTTLQTRRVRGDMIQAYKIMTGKDKIDREQFFQLADSNYGLRGHSLKIRKDRPNLDIRKHFFSQRVVNAWNKLPQHVVDAPSVNCFKNRLDKHWEDMDVTSCIA